MKSLILYMLISTTLLAQTKQPVNWKFKVSRSTDSMYAIEIKAHIDKEWHIYSQKQPKNHVCEPTSIKILNNQFFKPGKYIIEAGTMIKWTSESAKVTNYQYYDSVLFVQTLVPISSNIHTSITIVITWQQCTEDFCMPPISKAFTVPINPE